MENQYGSSSKIKNRTIIWFNNLTSALGIYPMKMKMGCTKRYLHSHSYCNIIHVGQDKKTIYMPTNGWMDKICGCVCKFSHEKDEILPLLTTWMDLKGIMLNQINQTEKDKYCLISLTVEPWKKINSEKQKVDWLPRVGVWSKWGDVSQQVLTSSIRVTSVGI